MTPTPKQAQDEFWRNHPQVCRPVPDKPRTETERVPWHEATGRTLVGIGGKPFPVTGIEVHGDGSVTVWSGATSFVPRRNGLVEVLVDVPPDRPAPAEVSALYDFLDALVLAKQNDDVMSVVDAMLATYAEGQVNAEVDVPPDPTAPECSTCQDKGVVYTRCGVNDWDPEDCPDCPPVQPQDEPTSRWIADGNLVRGPTFDLLIVPEHDPVTILARSAFARDVADLLNGVEGASQPQPDTPDLTGLFTALDTYEDAAVDRDHPTRWLKHMDAIVAEVRKLRAVSDRSDR